MVNGDTAVESGELFLSREGASGLGGHSPLRGLTIKVVPAPPTIPTAPALSAVHALPKTPHRPTFFGDAASPPCLQAFVCSLTSPIIQLERQIPTLPGSVHKYPTPANGRNVGSQKPGPFLILHFRRSSLASSTPRLSRLRLPRPALHNTDLEPRAACENRAAPNSTSSTTSKSVHASRCPQGGEHARCGLYARRVSRVR
jgi:hypothetical protein